MRGGYRMVVVVVGMWLASGCRTATRVVESPRVDLDLSHGNRGYLVGTVPPATSNAHPSRQIVETEIEVPGFVKAPARRPAPVGGGTGVPSPMAQPGAQGVSGTEAPERFDTYVVKSGETLWSIAAQPEVFGDAGKWRWLYEANRDVLKKPNRLRAGMTLRVPRGGTFAQTAGHEARRYSK